VWETLRTALYKQVEDALTGVEDIPEAIGHMSKEHLLLAEQQAYFYKFQKLLQSVLALR
jgi:hypothetical protein